MQFPAEDGRWWVTTPIAEKLSLKALVGWLDFGETARAALAAGRVLAPLDHSGDPAHLIVTGTGPDPFGFGARGALEAQGYG